MARRINAVKLEDVLRKVQTDRSNLLHGRLREMGCRSQRPHLGTTMPRWGRPPHHLNLYGAPATNTPGIPKLSDRVFGADCPLLGFALAAPESQHRPRLLFGRPRLDQVSQHLALELLV